MNFTPWTSAITSSPASRREGVTPSVLPSKCSQSTHIRQLLQRPLKHRPGQRSLLMPQLPLGVPNERRLRRVVGHVPLIDGTRTVDFIRPYLQLRIRQPRLHSTRESRQHTNTVDRTCTTQGRQVQGCGGDHASPQRRATPCARPHLVVGVPLHPPLEHRTGVVQVAQQLLHVCVLVPAHKQRQVRPRRRANQSNANTTHARCYPSLGPRTKTDRHGVTA